MPLTTEEFTELGQDILDHERERRATLAAALRELAGFSDPEIAHTLADDFLLAFIDDDEVRAAFAAVPKWYA